MSQVATGGADRPAPGEAGERMAGDGRRRRLATVLGLVLIAVAVALAVVFATTSGVPDDRIVDRTVELHGREPGSVVPPGAPVVAGLRFPSLARQGWVPVGARRDAVGDRDAVTVFYGGRDGRRLAVTILSGQALPPPPGSRVVRRGGVAFARRTADDRVVVSWRRAGRTTVMSVVGLPAEDVLALAGAATPAPR